jgi:hypothetical protein
VVRQGRGKREKREKKTREQSDVKENRGYFPSTSLFLTSIQFQTGKIWN